MDIIIRTIQTRCFSAKRIQPILVDFNPLVAELFCHKLDLLKIVDFLCTFLQHAVC